MATTNLGKVSVTPKGEYDPLITYERLDIINHNGSSYIAKQTSIGVTPIEGEFYALIAEKGDGGSFVKKAYKTYAAMDADKVNIPANSSVDVTNDPDESKNGAYIYDGVAFTRSQYDSKVVTDKIIADTELAVNAAINGVAIDANLLSDALLTTVPIAGTLGGIKTQVDKNREAVSLLDFFTRDEYVLWLTQKSTFNVSRPLQEFFDYISANDVGVAYCSGKYRVSQGILLGGLEGCATKTIIGELELTANAGAAIDTILTLQPSHHFTWVGTIAVLGDGGGTWLSRSCNNGIVVGSDGTSGGTSGRAVFGTLRAQRVRNIGVLIDDNCSLMSISKITAISCGSRKEGTTSLGGNFTHAGNSGGQNSITQRSTLSVTELPPERTSADAPQLIFIDSELYSIRDVDRAAGTISVFPWVDTAKLTGAYHYIFGGAVHIRGRDSSVVNIGVIDARLCGIGLHDYALYASVVTSLIAQLCGIGLAKGGATGSANAGGSVGGFYTEGNDCDILQLSRVLLGGFTITSKYALDYNKIWSISPKSASFVQTPHQLTDVGLVGANGGISVFENAFNSASIIDFSCTSDDRFDLIGRGNTVNVKINAERNIQATVQGKLHRNLKIVGTGSNYAPTGTVTFTPPVGYTINNSITPITYKDFTAIADFEVIYNPITLNYMVACKNLSNIQSIAYAAQTIEAGATTSTVIPIAGTKVGDFVSVVFSKPLLGLRAWGEVTVAGELTVYLHNPTALPVTTTAMDVRIKLN